MENKELQNIAADYGTPTYVFDERALRSRVKIIRDTIPSDVGLCYAMKANPFLTGVMSGLTDRLEVCSPGEYEICIRQSIPPDRIIVSGVNKTASSMQRIFEYSGGAGIYTIESELHYDILKECALQSGVKLKVLIRLSSGNQFGMDGDALWHMLERIISDDAVVPIGIHYYSGTQKKLKKVGKELEMLDEYALRLKEHFAIDRLELEYGPGLMVSYFENEQEPDAAEQLDELSKLLSNVKAYDEITIELGRFLVSECGSYITRVMDVKHNDNSGYLIVDGGIHQLSYFGQLMGMKKPHIRLLSNGRDNAGGGGHFNICGSLCTVNDVIVRDMELEEVCVGDVIVFERCGAYSVTEGMALFLSRELPCVILMHEDGHLSVLRNKQEINFLNSQREDV